MTGLDDTAWNELLDSIESGDVIPIVGSGLCISPEIGGSLYDWLASELACRLNVDLSRLAEVSVNRVICSYLMNSFGGRQDPYPEIRKIIDGCEFNPPDPLLQLASIEPFNLFITTTFDPLLENAINQVRHGGNPLAAVLKYSPNDAVDLPGPKEDLGDTDFEKRIQNLEEK